MVEFPIWGIVVLSALAAPFVGVVILAVLDMIVDLIERRHRR